MNLEAFSHHMENRLIVKNGSPMHLYMSELAQDAMRTTAKLNAAYHTPDEIIDLMVELTGRPVDSSFRMFPPFHTDCGKNITLGKMCLSTPAVTFKIRAALPLATTAKLGTVW